MLKYKLQKKKRQFGLRLGRVFSGLEDFCINHTVFRKLQLIFAYKNQHLWPVSKGNPRAAGGLKIILLQNELFTKFSSCFVLLILV